jgi:hypothetical protein
MRLRTFQQLAESYELRAADEEAVANRIIVGLNIMSKEQQLKQLASAETLLQEAHLLRQEAAGLREAWSLLKLPPHLRQKDFLSHIPKTASQLVLRRLNILRPLQ